MAIAHSKQVSVGTLLEIWVQNEAVLVLLLWVARHVAHSRRKSILCHDVLLYLLRKRFWYNLALLILTTCL